MFGGESELALLDLTVGSGAMLGGLASAVADLGYTSRVLGQELNCELATVAAATLYLQGHRAEVRVADSLSDDAFADEWSFVATHTGPFALPDGNELPATGKRIELRGMELVEVRDGKIVVDNLYYDNMAVLAQLGLIPQGAPA